jgi:ABC-type sugar transport system ATPase subunit
MAIDLENLEQPVDTLSGGQRQVIAIARAVHFGARVLILDEPTAALGVAQSGLVLHYIVQAAREQGIGVIFITHDPHHAYLVCDHIMVLARGEVDLDHAAFGTHPRQPDVPHGGRPRIEHAAARDSRARRISATELMFLTLMLPGGD